MNLKKRFAHKGTRGGFTLTEVIISAAVMSAMLAVMAIAGTSLQRSFWAGTNYTTAHADQMRVLDYITRDLRNARTVTVTNGGTRLALTLPEDYDAFGNPRDPYIVDGKVVYGDPTVSITVAYYEENNRFIRELNGVKIVIADETGPLDVDFSPVILDGVTVSVETNIRFTPRFRRAIQTTSSIGTTLGVDTYLRNSVAAAGYTGSSPQPTPAPAPAPGNSGGKGKKK
jgi:hypothetical protein